MKRLLVSLALSISILAGCGPAGNRSGVQTGNILVGYDTGGNEYPMHSGIRAKYDTLILRCQEACHQCSSAAYPAYWKADSVNVDSLVAVARMHALEIRKIAEEAKDLISPADSERFRWADAVASSGDDIIFYLDRYSSGHGGAYIDKAEVQAGLAWTFCLEALLLPDSEE